MQAEGPMATLRSPAKKAGGSLSKLKPKSSGVSSINMSRTPREIAHDMNNEGVSPPRGRSWNASTINGNMQRGTGIIQNELYAGCLVWNKIRMVKDPDTARRRNSKGTRRP